MRDVPMRLHMLRTSFRLLTATAVISSLAMIATLGTAQAATDRVTAQSSAVSTANKGLAPYTGHPNAFPVTEKLKKKPMAGTTIDYLECGAPTCATAAADLKAPIAKLGGKLDVVSAGFSSSTVQSAANTALANHPAAVIVAGITLSDFGGTLSALEKAGIPVFGIGVTGGQKYGLTAVSGGQNGDVQAGQLMADWVLVHKGTHANIVFFGAPELSFSPYVWNAFSSQLKKICPSCKATQSQLSVLTFGSSAAPTAVVSYLRANPAVNTTVFVAEEGAQGLPSALSAAGLSSITTFGFAPTSVNLADIKAGKLAGGLGIDLNLEAWVISDMIAKSLTHQKIPAAELNGVVEVLNKSNVTTADIENGWEGYPDVAQRFAKLWP
jgi:ribose transport system substrate-binding protein